METRITWAYASQDWEHWQEGKSCRHLHNRSDKTCANREISSWRKQSHTVLYRDSTMQCTYVYTPTLINASLEFA